MGRMWWDPLGIALTASPGSGTWQYSTDGSTWAGVGTVSNSAALLLSSSTQLRYVPDGKNGGNRHPHLPHLGSNLGDSLHKWYQKYSRHIYKRMVNCVQHGNSASEPDGYSGERRAGA